MIYRVLWDVQTEKPKTMASEYATEREAETHRADIAGWIPNARIEPIDEDRAPERGPFEVKGPASSWERLDE